MVTNRNIDDVIRTLKRLVRRWQEPVVGHYRYDPFTTLISCLLSLRTKDETTRGASERLFRLARTPRALLALPVRTIEEAADGLRENFTRAVSRRLRTDDPVAISVSGGLDSSSIFCHDYMIQ